MLYSNKHKHRLKLKLKLRHRLNKLVHKLQARLARPIKMVRDPMETNNNTVILKQMESIIMP